MESAAQSTATNTTTANQTQSQPAQNQASKGQGFEFGLNEKPTNELPFKVPQPKQKFASKAEETLAGFRINEPTADEVEDTAAMNAMIDRAQSAANGEANEAPDTKRVGRITDESRENPETVTRERLKVGDEEFELDAEQIKRFAQKGIHYEKANRKAADRERALAAREQEITRLQAEALEIYENLKNPQNLMQVIEKLHGSEQARMLTEGYLKPIIEREMLPPEQQEMLSLKERAERAEQILQQQQFMQQQQVINARAQELQNHYQQTIINALQKINLPTGQDFTFLAKEMAGWLERGITNNVEYTPEQLAEKVLEDNNARVGLLVSHDAQAVLKAKQSGDANKVIELGERLAQKLGEPVVYAIARYHLAKHERQQKSLPQKEILSTPKTVRNESKKAGYMTPDEYAAERRRRVEMMERGEDPGEWI